jgi:hypothetical protein
MLDAETDKAKYRVRQQYASINIYITSLYVNFYAMKMPGKKIIIAVIVAVFATINIAAQNSVGINTDSPNKHAALQVASPASNQGVLLPALTTAQRLSDPLLSSLRADASAKGLLVFDKNTDLFYYWDGTNWKPILAGNLAGVLIQGNSAGGMVISSLADPITGTDAANKFYVDGKVDAIVVDIEDLTEIVNQHTQSISNINQQITQINGQITIINDSINTFHTRIEILKDSVNNYHTRIEVLKDSVVNYHTRIEIIKDSVNNYHTRIEVLKDSIVSYHTRIEVIRDSIVQLRDNFITLKEEITKLITIVEEAEFKLPEGFIYLGGPDGLAATVPVAGNISISPAGVFTINNGTVTDDMLRKPEIPISGFGPAVADVAIGSLAEPRRLLFVGLPADGWDAANKAYVDAGMSVHNDSIISYNSRIGQNKARIIELEGGNFSLSQGSILIGDASGNSTEAVLHGDLAIEDATGLARIQPEAVKAANMSGITGNGAVGQVLVSLGNGSFEWQGKLQGGMSDDLAQGYIWTGNAANKAVQSQISAIPLSSFGPADTDIAAGSIAQQNRITMLAAPADGWDAANKAYVDAGMSVHNDSIISYNSRIGQNKARIIELEGGNFSLSQGSILIGDASGNSTEAVLHGDLAIEDATGLARIQPEAVKAANMSGITGNGAVGQVLVSLGNGSFEWQGKLQGGMSDDLAQGYIWTGNAANKAVQSQISAIPLSSFGPADTDIAAGSIAQQNRITMLAAPADGWDAATKSYVDDSTAANRSRIATNKASIDALSAAINAAGLDDEAVPVWDGSSFANSSVWSNGSSVVIGGAVKPTSYGYDLEVNGSFKTQKIYHASDSSWKKQIETISGALNKVLELRGVEYYWRTDEFPANNFSNAKQIGLIAQEIEAVMPELVITDSAGFKAVEYANLVALLIEAIKDQQKLIDSQGEKIETLKSQNETFENRLKKIEATLKIK